MNGTQSAHPQIVGRGRAVQGSLGGIKQPSLIFSVVVPDALDLDLQKSEDIAGKILGFLDAGPEANSEDPSRVSRRFIDVYLECISSVLKACQHPIFYTARILSETPQARDRSVFKIQQPCMAFNAGLAAIILCTDCFEAALGSPGETESFEVTIPPKIQRHLKALKRGQLQGFNMHHFLRAAHDLNVPWLRISGETFQFGYGCNARLLNSSLSDRTSWMGNSLAKNKVAASRVLKLAGLPVAEQVPVSSREQALEVARKIGLPVVVKPVGLDGGQGVTAFLTRPNDVAQAFDDAAKLLDSVVVEKHFQGKDYRIQVVDGTIQGILERSPGGITGDGLSKVEDLIARQNAVRKQATDDRRFLHPILTDRECRRMLEIQGLGLESIPSAGQFVQLRGAANVASGGVPSLVDVSEAHPDNIDLALRATRIMRLDVAGVDLIIPDIGTSWLETGAAICEVNAQPQMFTTFHQPMLEKLLGKGRGHIPICLVLEPQDKDGFGQELFEALLANRPNVGFISTRNAFFGNKPAPITPNNVFDATRSLLVDPFLEGLVLSLPAEIPVTNGWPVDQCDVIICNTPERDGQGKPGVLDSELLTEAVETLSPRILYLAHDAVSSWSNTSNPYGGCSLKSVDFDRIQTSQSARADLAAAIVNAVLDMDTNDHRV